MKPNRQAPVRTAKAAAPLLHEIADRLLRTAARLEAQPPLPRQPRRDVFGVPHEGEAADAYHQFAESLRDAEYECARLHRELGETSSFFLQVRQYAEGTLDVDVARVLNELRSNLKNLRARDSVPTTSADY